MKKEKLRYVAPAVESCRVVLESGIVATLSPGKVSAQIESWSDGGEYVLGDDSFTEGGDTYLPM